MTELLRNLEVIVNFGFKAVDIDSMDIFMDINITFPTAKAHIQGEFQ